LTTLTLAVYMACTYHIPQVITSHPLYQLGLVGFSTVLAELRLGLRLDHEYYPWH